MLDVIVGLVNVVAPIKVVLIWATFWGLVTAAIRPISGEPIWDLVEMSSNWAAPLALLLLQGLPKSLKDLIKV